ncbi:MAG: hypothetical protein LC749_00935, partial [Actinobacteria bacterium]|nr:hypothetical protein [Actinomycetota bacterium]
DLLHETWLRNLSNWFDELPDGPVLWAEQLRLRGAMTGPVEAERLVHLMLLTRRALPMLSEVLLGGRPPARRAGALGSPRSGSTAQPDRRGLEALRSRRDVRCLLRTGRGAYALPHPVNSSVACASRLRRLSTAGEN